MRRRVEPGPAERVRTIGTRPGRSVLALPGCEPVVGEVHVVRESGDGLEAVVLLDRDVAATEPVPALLELTDLAPVALADPVRALVWLRGSLTAVPAADAPGLAATVAETRPDARLLDVGRGASLARLTITSAVLADGAGAAGVSVADLLAARPDPVAELEEAWLQHLETGQRDLLQALARHVPPSAGCGRLRASSLDRFGLRLRVERSAAGSSVDVRVPFREPVHDGLGISRELRVLARCPGARGLHRVGTTTPAAPARC